MKKWYAVLRDADDNDWGTGSYDFETAKKMLLDAGYDDGRIAVIEMGNDPVCVEVFTMDEIKDRAEELLAGELYEMVALGWTDEEARENEDAFFERIGDYADGLTKEEVWQVWENVIENA